VQFECVASNAQQNKAPVQCDVKTLTFHKKLLQNHGKIKLCLIQIQMSNQSSTSVIKQYGPQETPQNIL
jgi:hypothetical protein